MNLPQYKNVGIVGIPPIHIIQALNDAGTTIHDLDAKLVPNSIDGVTPYLPKVYCAILRTVVLNALNLELEAIYIDTGVGKCDAARHVATILENTLTIPIIQTKNEDSANFGTPICKSFLDLTEKFLMITEDVKSAKPEHPTMKECLPTAGFWGVPPKDFAILQPFPPTTHIYGWSRCMENKTPANIALEEYYNKDIPTIFFGQSFCAKTALAKFLAGQHPHALFLDVDYNAGSSAKAKVQAFLELSGALP